MKIHWVYTVGLPTIAAGSRQRRALRGPSSWYWSLPVWRPSVLRSQSVQKPRQDNTNNGGIVIVICNKPATNRHTGDKVEFNPVDFVKSGQSRPCHFGPVHTGVKVNRIGNKVDRIAAFATKLTELATMLTVTSCRIQVVANMSPKPATKLIASATVDLFADLLLVLATVDFVASVYRALHFQQRVERRQTNYAHCKTDINNHSTRSHAKTDCPQPVQCTPSLLVWYSRV